MKRITIGIAIALLTIFGTEAIASATATANPISGSVIVRGEDCKGDKDDCQ
jgi:hypothetical protein